MRQYVVHFQERILTNHRGRNSQCFSFWDEPSHFIYVNKISDKLTLNETRLSQPFSDFCLTAVACTRSVSDSRASMIAFFTNSYSLSYASLLSTWKFTFGRFSAMLSIVVLSGFLRMFSKPIYETIQNNHE